MIPALTIPSSSYSVIDVAYNPPFTKYRDRCNQYVLVHLGVEDRAALISN